MPETKEKKTWVTYLQRAGYVAAALVSIATLIYGTASYVQPSEAAATEHEQIVLASDSADYKANQDREKGDLRTQIELINLELKFLEDKPDDTRKEYLLQQRQILMQRLQELQGADA